MNIGQQYESALRKINEAYAPKVVQARGKAAVMREAADTSTVATRKRKGVRKSKRQLKSIASDARHPRAREALDELHGRMTMREFVKYISK